MKLLEAKTSNAVAVEDSIHGFKSATSAGLKCIIIKNSFMSVSDFSGAEEIIDSITDLPKILL